MPNSKNLIPNDARTPSERRKNAKKAGVASGEARRQKSTAKTVAEMVLSGNIPVDSAEELLNKMGLPKTELNVQAAIIANQAIAAMNGNTKAAEFVLGLVGEKPSDKVQMQISYNPHEDENWVKTRTAILYALDPFPEAKLAVAAALKEVDV